MVKCFILAFIGPENFSELANVNNFALDLAWIYILKLSAFMLLAAVYLSRYWQVITASNQAFGYN